MQTPRAWLPAKERTRKTLPPGTTERCGAASRRRPTGTIASCAVLCDRSHLPIRVRPTAANADLVTAQISHYRAACSAANARHQLCQIGGYVRASIRDRCHTK